MNQRKISIHESHAALYKSSELDWEGKHISLLSYHEKERTDRRRNPDRRRRAAVTKAIDRSPRKAGSRRHCRGYASRSEKASGRPGLRFRVVGREFAGWQ